MKKIFLLMMFLTGCATQPAQIYVIHNPNPQPVVIYPTVANDPTARVFKNSTEYRGFLSIDGQPPIELWPGQATKDLFFSYVGEHRYRWVIEKPTQHFGVINLERFGTFTVYREGRFEIINLGY